MNVLVEAVGSPAWPTLLPFLRGVAERIVGLEVDRLAPGAQLVDRCFQVPPYREIRGPETFLRICEREAIELVLPSIHEGLPFWARERAAFEERGVRVAVSPPETIELFQDKWETFQFFQRAGIPTPETSLQHDYELLKPRIGRGAAGIRRAPPGSEARLDGYVSQRFLRGQEVSVDLLCDRAGEIVYKVQRERLAVASGLAVRARVVRDPEIDRLVDRIAASARFLGIVNLQCFRESDGVFFTEVNPRIPGGLSLSMAATENWFPVLLKLLAGEPIERVETRLGLLMLRHYSDVFADAGDVDRRFGAVEDAPHAGCREIPNESSS